MKTQNINVTTLTARLENKPREVTSGSCSFTSVCAVTRDPRHMWLTHHKNCHCLILAFNKVDRLSTGQIICRKCILKALKYSESWESVVFHGSSSAAGQMFHVICTFTLILCPWESDYCHIINQSSVSLTHFQRFSFITGLIFSTDTLSYDHGMSILMKCKNL